MIKRSGSDTYGRKPRLLFVVSEDWYFCSHRLALAQTAFRSGFDVSVATRVNTHAETITGAGLRLHRLKMVRRRLNPLAEIGSIVELAALFKRERPDIIHAVAMKPITYSAIASVLLGCPRLVYSVSGLGSVFISSNWRGRMLRPLLRMLLRFALCRTGAVTVVQNADDERRLIKLGVSANCIEKIAGSGIDLSRFCPSKSSQSPVPSPYVLASCVARMLADKGIRELAEAARILRARSIPVRIALVGNPDPHNPTSVGEPQLHEWHKDGLIEWMGQVDDVSSVWSASQIALLPSYREGLPQSLLEAAACGVAMVASDVPGCREVCLDGQTGIVVPPRDAVALAEAIESLVCDAALRERYGRAARALAEKLFGSETIHAQFLCLYRRMMNCGMVTNASIEPIEQCKGSGVSGGE